MPPAGDVERSWFVPGTGIDRHVITTDIQRYLGNDATARPGIGNGAYAGVPGYWIKAYRNLTTAMISDLKADSTRWIAEQRATGQRGSHSPDLPDIKGITVPNSNAGTDYGGSAAQNAAIERTHQGQGRARASPSTDTMYAAAALRDRKSDRAQERLPQGRPSGDRIADRRPVERMPMDRMPVERTPVSRAPIDRYDDAMDVDPPAARYPDRELAGGRGGLAAGPRYDSDRVYQTDPRDPRQPFAGAEPVGYGRAGASAAAYGQDADYGRGPFAQPANGGAPQGYVRRGDSYIPISALDQPGLTARADPTPYGYGAPQLRGQDARDPRDIRDPRDMRDPRDVRDGRDLRDVRDLREVRGDPRDIRGNDMRDIRDPREMRDQRDPRDGRERDMRDARDPREARGPREVQDPRDARYAQDYAQDPRYAYPSPAATVSVPMGREHLVSPPQQRFADTRPSDLGRSADSRSPYGMSGAPPAPAYNDPYGGGARPPTSGQPDPRDPRFGGAQLRAPPGAGRDAANGSDRDARRRRLG